MAVAWLADTRPARSCTFVCESRHRFHKPGFWIIGLIAMDVDQPVVSSRQIEDQFKLANTIFSGLFVVGDSAHDIGPLVEGRFHKFRSMGKAENAFLGEGN